MGIFGTWKKICFLKLFKENTLYKPVKKLGLVTLKMGFPCSTSGKEPVRQCRRHKRHGFHPWVWKIPWRRAWQPTPVLFPGDSYGWGAWQVMIQGSQRIRHDWSDLACMHTCMHAYWRQKYQTRPFFFLVEELFFKEESWMKQMNGKWCSLC